jgi:hypothetical protein
VSFEGRVPGPVARLFVVFGVDEWDDEMIKLIWRLSRRDSSDFNVLLKIGEI